eukprot:TRINITY_DN40841_c0_g1_i1.p1 TRINITY_DN40841_c0_g1~~TRINITY_DN40841_c0_g1_i1.p1  ORF type:complete len:260 (-),score=66.97 TRINITY_DN40841_c0_g1_i1:380-1159(-)
MNMSADSDAKKTINVVQVPGSNYVEDDHDVPFADVTVTVGGKSYRESASALAVGSMVFRAMLESEMQEGVTKTIDLPGKAADEYALFRKFFRAHACAVGASLLTEENIDILLPWFHEYQMPAMLEECENILLKAPATAERLVQASAYGLSRQYQRCLHAVAADFVKMNVAELVKEADVMADLLPLLHGVQAKEAAQRQEEDNKRISAVDDCKDKVLEQVRSVHGEFFTYSFGKTNPQGYAMSVAKANQVLLNLISDLSV